MYGRIHGRGECGNFETLCVRNGQIQSVFDDKVMFRDCSNKAFVLNNLLLRANKRQKKYCTENLRKKQYVPKRSTE